MIDQDMMAPFFNDGGAMTDATSDLAMIAVKNDPYIISAIREVSDDIKIAALKQDGTIIGRLRPHEHLCVVAIKQNPLAIYDIYDPSVELKLLAIWHGDDKLIEYDEWGHWRQQTHIQRTFQSIKRLKRSTLSKDEMFWGVSMLAITVLAIVNGVLYTVAALVGI